ncbi:MAG: MXAN_6640 family putative metalloprotease [Myxococcaceae bacterium]
MRALVSWVGCALVVLASACEPAEPIDRGQPVVHRAEQALRPTDVNSGLMWVFKNGETVENYDPDGGRYRVHYTRMGVDAVPLADANDSGVPDFVEDVGDTYDSVGGLYHDTLLYRRPTSDQGIADNGGDGRFDVYLVDFGLSADGAFRVDQCPPSSPSKCIGYVVEENDFAGYGYPSLAIANRILASHEYFHAVQAAYDDDQSVVVSEGTAVWATERYAPQTNDFEGFVHGYLERPDRSIDSPPPGPVPTFAYGSAIFFKFLSERHGDDVIRKLWEHLENGQGDPTEPMDQTNPTFLIQLDAVLKRDYQTTFGEDFAQFARWNLYTASAGDPDAGYAEGSKYPAVAMTLVTLPAPQENLRVFYASTQYFTAPAGGRTRVTAALVDTVLTTTDDTQDLVLWLAARKGGKNTEVVKVTNRETVDISGGAVIVGVVNTRRGAVGAAQSQRPSLCIGTPDEVNACVAALGGVVDAGVDAGLDAGAGDVDGGADGGTLEPPNPTGCGCGMTPVPLWFLAVIAGRLLLRRRTQG